MKIFEKFKNYIINEVNLGRLWQHTQHGTIGMISASRGNLTAKDNAIRTKQLGNAIRTNGFGYVPVEGFYIENPGTPEETKVKEQSFLVISKANDKGKLRNFLTKFGREFDQDSVLYKEEQQKAILIGTAAGRWPGLNVEFTAGDWKPNKIGQFYSKMKNHRTFTFESVEVPSNVLTLGYQPKE